MLKENELRYKRVNTCAECRKGTASCSDGHACDVIKKKLGNYSSLKYTSDGFDCALPVAIDSHSACSYGCLYCFAVNIIERRHHYDLTKHPVGQLSLSTVETLFSGKGGEQYNLIRKALKYDRKVNGYPCPIQLGALTDPCDSIERQQGWLLHFIDLAIKYKQPVRISTKGNIFLVSEYLEKIAKNPELFWVAFSINSPDDTIITKIDKRAPNATERLKTMKALSEVGVNVSLRVRPILPGVSDATARYPQAYKTLVERAAEAGAKAMSMEVAFVPGGMTKEVKAHWQEIEQVTHIPILKVYSSFGHASCIRPPYQWTEGIMHAYYDEAKNHELLVGVSDPVWKQLTETGCCCGIAPDDPVFGNWERENATNLLLQSKLTGCEIKSDDIIPPCAYHCKHDSLANPGVGPLAAYGRRHYMWSNKLKDIWNHPEKERSPLNYFQGALVPIRREGDEVIYKYRGVKRTNKKEVPYWNINEDIQKLDKT